MNPIEQEYKNAIKRRLKQTEKALSYQNIRYKEYQKEMTPNYVPKETIEAEDYENYNSKDRDRKALTYDTNSIDFRQKAKENLEILLSVSDAQTIMNKMTETEMKRFNQFYETIKINLRTVKFYNADEFYQYIKTFLQAQINDGKVDGENKVINARLTLDKSFTELLEEAEKLRKEVDEYLGANEPISKDATNVRNQIYDIIKQHAKANKIPKDVLRELQEQFDDAIGKGNEIISDGRFKTKSMKQGQKPAYYRDLMKYMTKGFYEEAQKLTNNRAIKGGDGLRDFRRNLQSRNVPEDSKRRLIRNRNVKIGYGAENYHIHKTYYIDLIALNDNVLQIKYVKTGNKKLELGLSDNTKQIINQLINKKFNANAYSKLTESEKKVIVYTNSIFKFIDENYLNNPIDDLFYKYQILKGQALSSNDNKTQIKMLKEIGNELLKHKRINKSELKNLFYEIQQQDNDV